MESCRKGNEKVGISVKVDVAKIVGYCCMASVMIVGIIFGTGVYKKIIENGQGNKK